jgi:hypothetical protein
VRTSLRALTGRSSRISEDCLVRGRFYAIGPLLTDDLWETTAVRELRSQAAERGRRLLGLTSTD